MRGGGGHRRTSIVDRWNRILDAQPRPAPVQPVEHVERGSTMSDHRHLCPYCSTRWGCDCDVMMRFEVICPQCVEEQMRGQFTPGPREE